MFRILPAAVAMVFLFSCATIPQLNFDIKQISATTETEPVSGFGDILDDPAIWVHPARTEHSLILGTNKNEGLHVYSLNGKELQFLDVGRINNVDIRGSIAVASNDEVNGLSWFKIRDIDGTVSHIGDTLVDRTEPYGVCLGMIDGALTAAVTYKDGAIEFWETNFADTSSPHAKLVQTKHFSSQLEGCVFDDNESMIFIGEETVGIWALDVGVADTQPGLIDRVNSGSGLTADVEGLSLWRGQQGHGYLVASAQNADQFVVYNRQPPYSPQGVFRIGPGESSQSDAVTHTDGLDISSTAVTGYPRGLMVVHDDGNPAPKQNQNFKLIDWSSVEQILDLSPQTPETILH